MTVVRRQTPNSEQPNLTTSSMKFFHCCSYNGASVELRALRSLGSVGGTAMQLRVFGRTGMQLSVLGFGCGAVGGIMVRGDAADQERTIARAIAAGVNYFDTAVQYGNGESEKSLGRVLQKLKPTGVTVGTKVRVPAGEVGHIANV